jgi:hypothetical protein
MVERNISNIPQVTEVTPNLATGTMESAIGDAGQEIIKAEQHAMIVNNFSKANMDLNDAKLKFQNDYADKPMEGVKAYQEYREETLNSYGDQISPFFRGIWNQESKNMGIRDDMQMNGWAYAQLRQNTVTGVNNAIATNLGQANTDGMNYGSGKISDIDAVLNGAPSRELLKQFGGSNLGVAKTEGLLKNYDNDYMKSFISGVAQANPQKAAQLLDSDTFKDRFTTEDRNDFAALIEKTQKSNELIGSLKITQNTQQITDLVNAPDKTFYEKRLTIDTMEQQGAISNTAAANARRVLTSKDAVDAVTDAPVMADLTKRIYDLNQQSGMNNTDYLIGVQNIHNEILDAQAQGKLNASDVQKMNNEMKTLTSARVSSATKSVGSDMYEAVEKFDALPPEYRGEATRQLFYATQGQMATLSPDAYKTLTITKAQEVIDKINAERRQTAVKALTQPQADLKDELNKETQDNQFLKKIQTTPQEVEQFARSKNVPVSRVMDALRKKYAQ